MTLSKKCARPRTAAAGLERGARPAATLGPAAGRCASQQILAYETDLLEYAGPLRRLPRVAEDKTRELKAGVEAQSSEGARDGRSRGRGRERLHEAGTSSSRRPCASAGDRVRRADRGGREPLHQETVDSPLTAGQEPSILDRRRIGRAKQIERLEAFRRRRNARPTSRAALRNLKDVLKNGGQRDAAVDPLRGPRGCHHGRVVRCAARARSASTAHRPAWRDGARPNVSDETAQCESRVHALSETPRAPDQDPGRQARPRRPQQRRRADRRARARRGHGGRLRGHPAHARSDRAECGGRRRPCDRPVDLVRLPRRARARRARSSRNAAPPTASPSWSAGSSPRTTPRSCSTPA